MKKLSVSFSNPKAYLLNAAIALGLAMGTLATGQAAEFKDSSGRPDCKPAIWHEVKLLAQDCQELRDEKGERCEAIAFLDDRSVMFEIQGHEYKAEILESEFSDGGDLNDVLIDRDDGCRYELRNVPAEGDLLGALASVRTR